MKFNEIENLEYTTKEMLGYFIVAFEKVKNTEEKDLSAYIRNTRILLKTINKKNILKQIDTKLIAEFPICYLVNYEELMCFALVVFYNLLKSGKDINQNDIISQLKTEMALFSTRTITREAKRILYNMKD